MKVDKYDVVGDLLESNKKQFIIPVYQRNYEWNKIQCKKLFDDIIEAYEKKKKHFIGSIVYVELGEINKLHNYVIIDGQQRLTTLYLLLKAMYDTCSDKDGYAKEEISDILFNKDKYNDLNLTSQTKLKLKPIKTDNQQLLLLMNDDVDNMNLTSHIYLNYLYFKSLINITLSTKDIRIKDILDGLKQLVAAVIALKEGDDDPQVVFESINSTGLDLSLSDLIRNYVLMTDKNQDFLFENYWLKLEENINSNLMDSYIIDYLMFRIPTDTEFINALMITDLYHKKKTCKYLLKTLEDVNEDGTESKELVSIDKLFLI